MKRVNDIITVSELARLLNISRPTLYKYIDDYEKEDYSSMNYDYVMLFNFICSHECISKQQIYEYCMNQFQIDSHSSKALLDKIKILLAKDDKYKEFFSLILVNIDNIDIDDLNKFLKNK